MRMDFKKVKIILNWRPPWNVKSVRFLLGLINYFRRFIQYYDYLREPLVRLTRQEVSFVFESEETKAFKVLKAAVTKELILKKWCPELPTRVETDASNGITGGVFSQ